MPKKKQTILEEYFQAGHLYEYQMNKFSQIKDNGGRIIKKVLLLKKVMPHITKDMLFEDIENGEEQIFYYEDYNIDTLKKIS